MKLWNLLNKHYYARDLFHWTVSRITLGKVRRKQDEIRCRACDSTQIQAEAKSRSKEAHQSKPEFLLTTLFLRRCYQYLMKNQNESIAYLSGPTLAGKAILDELIQFDMERQEVCYVKGNIVSSTEALMMLSDRGYTLLGTIHCHPGGGAGATLPSGIDKKHHQRLEGGHFKALGIIMTRDGFTRFYSDKMPFSVEIRGDDGFWVEDDVYKLELDYSPPEDAASDEPDESEESETVDIPIEAAEAKCDD